MYDYEAVLMGAEVFFQAHTLMFLVVGFFLGFFVGSIPGFNDANIMAILLPFSLIFEPTMAIIAMVAIYTGAQAGGSIPAILLNIPGTPGNAASILDGYPMAKKGLAGYALGLSLGASTVGSLTGAVLALLLAPIIGVYALSFGPAEMFMVVLLGMTVVSTLAADNMTKGLLIAAFGILVSLMGADPMTGFARGTYNISFLYDGMPLIPVLLGLFGFSELLLLLGSKTVSDTADEEQKWSELFRGLKHAFRHRFNMMRSSLVGFVVGVIPGAGATIGSFLAYGMAKQWSGKPEEFGKGSPEGLIASDSANNATACGAVVPMLTLGVPGSASTLVMLAALVLHGVRPGPQFFANFQAESYAILYALFGATFLIAVLGMVMCRYMQRVVFIPTAILVPVVSVLIFIGAYAWRFLAFDIFLMIIFGLVGLLLRAKKYPVPAFLLAIILGPMLESNYLRATRIGGLDVFFESYLSIVLFSLVVLSVLAPFIVSLRKRRTA
ncbi:tripartite tricarboxylate transporter permease [Allopusillimonas ginsengisoli]|uniref:tripartite tricarboxylate transporter permease n=1 Tax=Allopusillimonas ginsengisoli TaxID=453575 RepID=UPI0010C1B371|nr:hypothetical protein D7I39_09270 [Allopusillimonas ginsengisoli]